MYNGGSATVFAHMVPNSIFPHMCAKLCAEPSLYTCESSRKQRGSAAGRQRISAGVGENFMLKKHKHRVYQMWQNYFLLENYFVQVYTFRQKFRMFYCPIPQEVNRNLPRPLQPDLVVNYDVFRVSQDNF